MARHTRLFKTKYNGFLEQIEAGKSFDSLSELAASLSMSRTTARKVLSFAHSAGLTSDAVAPISRPARPVTSADYFDRSETSEPIEIAEQKFLNWLALGSVSRSGAFSETKTANELGITAQQVRELCLKFSHYGFLRRSTNRHWYIDGFTVDYGFELLEVRSIFEKRALEKIIATRESDAVWIKLKRLKKRHIDLLTSKEISREEFSKLDEEFHMLFHSVSGNRLILSLREVISLIFHYNFKWSTSNVSKRYVVALHEHLKIIGAIEKRDINKAIQALTDHLETAKQELVSSLASN